ncbi:MAG TPA: Scr1 family TA system antitoxin-like transcriptional regulator [Pseudonocardiaceae bacterium]|nr:Scr1 family TA system antitoxin-like transcriptional regulator [Pseudonocardiaceae bacterium]
MARPTKVGLQKGTVVSISINQLLARQHVGQRLQAMREAAGFSHDTAARHLHLPADMLHQMESGQFAIPPPLAQAMTQMYGHPDPDVLLMARLARHRGQVADLAAWHLNQLAWECSTTRICEVAVTHIPELLHTSDYARAVWTSHARSVFAWQIKCTRTRALLEQSIPPGLTALASRQARLAGPPLLPVHIVITETALRAPLAPPEVMAQQWAHLMKVTAQCAVTVRVLPKAHSRLLGSVQHGWRVLDFSNTPEPRWLYRSSGSVNAPTEVEQTVAAAYRKYLRLRAATLSAHESQTFVQQLINNAATVSVDSQRMAHRP